MASQELSGREAMEAIRRSEARLASILTIAADAIISLNGKLEITLFNQGAETIFGYRKEEVLGRPLTLLLPERFRASHDAHISAFGKSAASARRMGERSEIVGLRKSGEEFPADASISHFTIDGEITYTAVLRDITEMKRAHELLAESHADLERRVAERTRELSTEIERRELAQAQLVRAQRMEAFGQLTGGIAHDFNNLLTVVTGNLELLEMRLKDEKNLSIVNRAKDAAEMGARLTNRLLMFARRRQLETATVNLNEHVAGMADLLRRTIGEHIELLTVLEPHLWDVRVDTSEVENAILNLAINSRDAMPEGGKLVIETANVRLEEPHPAVSGQVAPGDYVRLTVTDTGEGMSGEVRQRAFEPFFTTKQPGKGTGLGLSTIYGFVQQLGGSIGLYSEPGRGTSISIYLPRAETSGADAAGRQSAGPLPLAEGETILVVEDNPDVRRVTRARIEQLGYQVVEAETGPLAIEVLVAGTPIDLVFSDVVLAGGMSGFDVARWVQQNRPKIRILMTSGYPDEVLRSQDASAAALKMLRKPYNMRELADQLRASMAPGPAI